MTRFSWPDTREQALLISGPSLAAWVERALRVLARAPRFLSYVSLRRGRLLFVWGIHTDARRVAIYVRTRAWLFGRWLRVFWYDDFEEMPDDAKGAVREAVWQLIVEAERVERERASARWQTIDGAMKGG